MQYRATRIEGQSHQPQKDRRSALQSVLNAVAITLLLIAKVVLETGFFCPRIVGPRHRKVTLVLYSVY